MERYAKELPADSLEVLNALQVSGNTSAKTPTARWVLQKFYEEPAFAPLVEDAVAASKQVHMSPIPPEAVYIGIALVTMAFRFRRTRTDDGSGKVAISSEWSFDPLTAVKEGLPVLAESLSRAIRSLFGARIPVADSNADLLADWKDFDGRYHALQAQIAQQSAQVELEQVYKLAVQLCELIETFVARWRSSIIVPDLLQEIDTRRSFALQIKGSTGTVTGHWAEAREALETVVRDFTGERRAVAALGLGTGLLNRGPYNEAIPHLLTAIEEAGDLRIPTKIHAWSQLATCHFNLDRYAESKAAQQCAVDIAQQNGMSGEAAQLSLRLLCFETATAIA